MPACHAAAIHGFVAVVKEFKKAWIYFEELLVEEARGQVGLSNFDMAWTVVVLIVLILLILSFILLGMAAHQGENDFTTVIRSISVIFLGGITSYMRPYQNDMTDPTERSKAIEAQIAEITGNDGE